MMFCLVEPALPGVKVKERTANQLKRLPKAVVEELIRPFLLEAINNPDGVAALIERFLLARREQAALQALKTSSNKGRQGIGCTNSAASDATIKGQAPKLRCASCFTTWADSPLPFVSCVNCKSTMPLITLEEGLSYRAADTEWRLVVTPDGAQWLSDMKMSSTLKDDNSIDVSALAHSPIRAEQDDSNAVSNSMTMEVREQLSSLPLDDDNLHQAMLKAGEDPAALCADKSQVTMAFHPNVIAAYSKLQALQGDLQQVTSSAAEGAEILRCLPEHVVESEVRDMEDIRAGALEVADPTLVGQVLQRLDRNKLWEIAKKDFDMPTDPNWLAAATTTIEESRQQNRARQAEAEAELKASTPTYLNCSIWPDELRRAVENGDFNPFSVATPVTPEVFENQVSEYMDLRKALERNSDFLPKKFMSKFPNILKTPPKGTTSAAASADQVTFEFSLVTGKEHVRGTECTEDMKLSVLKWMLKQQAGVVKLATGGWKVRAGKFNPPEWVVKASTQLPLALKADLEANSHPSTFFVRQPGEKGPWKDYEIEEQVKLKTRPPPKVVMAGIMAPYDDSDNTVHWCKDVQSWNLPSLMQSMGDKFTCSEIWDYWCSLPALTPVRRRGERDEGSKRAAFNMQRLEKYKAAKEEASSLLKDMGLETAAVSAETWRTILKRIGTMLAASVFVTAVPQPLMELPAVEGHDSKQAMWERVMCDERITIPKEYLLRIPSLAADVQLMDKMVEVKVYYRCNTKVWWIQRINDPQLLALLQEKLAIGSAASGADAVERDVHMSAAPMETGTNNEGDRTAENPEEAIAAGSLPPPSQRNVICTIGNDYFKKNKLSGQRSQWFWFGAQCGLVMSAVSSWEIQTKEAGVHSCNGYICKRCRGKWSHGKSGGRMLDIFDGKHRLQVVLDAPDQLLFNKWAKERLELYKRLEPNAPLRDVAPPTDIPASHRVMVGPLVSDAIWEVVLGNHEAAGLRHVLRTAAQLTE